MLYHEYHNSWDDNHSEDAMHYIIAEIGFNHEGNMELAQRMIEAAARAGAHAVKFQTFKAIDLALPSAPHYEAIQCGEMDMEQHTTLARIASACNIDFLSTPFSINAVEMLESVGVGAYKIASMDCTNTYLLERIARTRKPVYLSTGMATLGEIAESLAFLTENKSGPVTLLHCLSCYPPGAEELNLAIIPFLKELFNVPVGYSDHFPGIQACLAAAMLGAGVIETHFTLDASQQHGDHSHSADPEMLRQLITDIGLFARMTGSREAVYKRPDRKWAKHYRRGMYAARDLASGDTLTDADLLLCRPTSQLSPNEIERIRGKSISRAIARYQEIREEFLKG